MTFAERMELQRKELEVSLADLQRRQHDVFADEYAQIEMAAANDLYDQEDFG